MRKRKILAGTLAVTLGGVGLFAAAPNPAGASSHREAPLISQDPVADNTDLWMWRDVADPTKVNIVANYIGLEQPASGPNFNRFGDDVRYEINIDNNGDVATDIQYQFRFRTTVENPNTFLYNTNRIDPATYANQNVKQSYSIRKVVGGSATTVATDVPTPPVYIGPRSDPNYDNDYVPASIKTVGGSKFFAGQRDDNFFADLGSIFDLLGLRQINDAHVIPLSPEPGRDGLRGKNVHSIVMQLPIAEVSANGVVPTNATDPDSVIGVYASSSRQRVKVLSSKGDAPFNAGKYVQVSRLGIPLVNEVLIPLGRKDLWNATDPEDDAQFFDVILDPEPTRLLPVLYPAVFNDANTPDGGAANRPDLIQLLTGQLIGIPEGGLPPADLLRINLAVAPVQGTVANRLAALAGDPGGFPNGRRLTDDVIDIELQVLAGILLDDDGIIDGTTVPYSVLEDDVDANDRPERATFPYASPPRSGYFQPFTG